jgi:FAD/FMN-containing dehydrogenase
MNRRRLLQILAALPLTRLWRAALVPAAAAAPAGRLRPDDAGWPTPAQWNAFGRAVGGGLVKVDSPLAACQQAPSGAACAEVFKELKNPYYLGDEVALTQTLGWVGAWTSRPSVWAVAAKRTADIVAAVKFARAHNLRLVIKGGGHSYLGGSNAPDSLLVWTRRMNAITLREAFVGENCAGKAAPVAAVTVEAGAMWGQVYNEVTMKGGRYAQGGGCLTVGVAGLLLGGGFGSFSKRYGLAAASLLEAEIVTADGEVRIANSCTNEDLFWALKGGGGAFGVVTRVTLRTHDLPEYFGAAILAVKANSDDSFRRLVEKIVSFYAEALFNPHWGEQIGFRPGRLVTVSMVFQGLDPAQAAAVWKPLFDWLAAAPQDFTIVGGPKVLPVPARHLWDPAMLKTVPGLVLSDDRPGAPAGNIFWASNLGETGEVLHAYQSAWLPAALLQAERRGELVDALIEATRHWGVTLHVNKGLAGAAPEAIEAAKDSAMNPAVTEAFALAISAAGEGPAYPGIAGHEPDVKTAARQAEAVDWAMSALRKLAPGGGSYVLETDYFQRDWPQAFWGDNYARLRVVKEKYDPAGLFFVHHGVGSEDWTEDGFSRAG